MGPLAVTARRSDSIAVEIVAVTDWGSAFGTHGSTFKRLPLMCVHPVVDPR